MNDLDCVIRARALNETCACPADALSLLTSRLAALEPELTPALRIERPHLFSESLVFISEAEVARIAELVAVIEEIVAQPSYQERVLEQAPAIARHAVPHRGAFLGFDFHLGHDGPQLIEINTNPGGVLLTALLDEAQQACCTDVAQLVSGAPARAVLEAELVAMFRREWQEARRVASADFSGFPRTVAIVDETPGSQYLYPEFQLFQRLFAAAGCTALILPPEALSLREGALWHGGQRIDLVYNRLTDFYFEAAGSAVLREAYLTDAAVITPSPRAHALYADKRNLALFSDPAALGVAEARRALLARHVPATRIVRREEADDLWAARRELFFKPAAGFGSKAAYRGDKLTRRVFEEILASDYVAQKLVPPSLRVIRTAGDTTTTLPLKLDLRVFAYAGRVQLFAARLWQGQTTNFRTPGGGFAAVRIVPCTEKAQGNVQKNIEETP